MQSIKNKITLNNGVILPSMGLGTFELQNEQSAYSLFKEALDAGYRHFDTAVMYGNHKIMGNAFRKIFSEGKYKRSDVFITTKCFSGKESCVEVLKQVLNELQMSYVDLYLIHFPMTFQEQSGPKIGLSHRPQHILYKELEEAYELNLTKAIGVSNYNVQSLLNVLSFCKVKPAVNEVEISVFCQQPHLIEFCQNYGMQIIGYGNLARGGLQVNTQLGNKIDIFNNRVLNEISAKHQCTVAQVVLNYLKNHLKVAVIPKSQKKERLIENYNCDFFYLDQNEVKQIQDLNVGLRTVDPYQLELFGNIDFFA